MPGITFCITSAFGEDEGRGDASGSCLGYAHDNIYIDIMSYLTYIYYMNITDKPLVWLKSEVKTPPFSKTARLEAGFLLRKLQLGEMLSMPHSRPIPSIGPNCHELRIGDKNLIWRIIYRIDTDAIIILHVFDKKTGKTPKQVLDLCKQRMKFYDSI